LYLHMEASQHSLLAACFTLHSINATLAIVPQRGAGLWITGIVSSNPTQGMDVCVRLFGVCPTDCVKDQETEEAAKA
jgi:hypothetical protein